VGTRDLGDATPEVSQVIEDGPDRLVSRTPRRVRGGQEVFAMRAFSVGTTFRYRGFQGLRGFDQKPLHPPTVHIPLGAWLVAGILDVASWIGGDATWASELHTAAGWTFLVGAIAAVIAVVTGLAERAALPRDSMPRRIANSHAMTMVVAELLVVANLLLRWGSDATVTDAPLAALSVGVLIVSLLGGMLGGHLVYGERIAVDRKLTARRDVDLREPRSEASRREHVRM
jgi:uncharacterized membrane protein